MVALPTPASSATASTVSPPYPTSPRDRKSTRLNSSHANISTLSLHAAFPIFHYEVKERADVFLQRPRVRRTGEPGADFGVAFDNQVLLVPPAPVDGGFAAPGLLGHGADGEPAVSHLAE